ncbi:unnamed protein product [Amoebophrya sp. A120]|nr:unnamed protein product [Amoebophrya sp. A120]|eukprot:GSA120T00008660001.1
MRLLYSASTVLLHLHDIGLKRRQKSFRPFALRVR